MNTRTIKAVLAAGLLALCVSPVLADLWVEGARAIRPRNWNVPSESVILGATTDSAGNVYVTGSFRGNLSLGRLELASALDTDHEDKLVRNLFVAKMDPAGNWVWASQADGDYHFAAAGPSSDSEGRGIAVLDDGNGEVSVYVTGWFTGTVGFGDLDDLTASDPNAVATAHYRNVVVAKLDGSGDWVWVTPGAWGDPAVGDPGGNAIAVNAAGRVFIAATVGDDAVGGGSNALAAGLDANGIWLWERALGTASDGRGTAVALDSGGDLRVAHTAASSGWVEKIDAEEGTADDTWGPIRINGAGHLAIALDNADNVIATGWYESHCLFVQKWLETPGSSPAWEHQLSDGTKGWAVALDGQVRRVVVAGQNGDLSILVASWGFDGSSPWQAPRETAGQGSRAAAVAISSAGVPYVGGAVGGETIFADGPGTDPTSTTFTFDRPRGTADGFVGKIARQGGYWANDRCSLFVTLEDEYGNLFTLDDDEPTPPADEKPTWFLEGSTVEWEVEGQSRTEGPKTPSTGRESGVDHFAYGWRILEDDTEVAAGRGNFVPPFTIETNRTLSWKYHLTKVHYVGESVTPPSGTLLPSYGDITDSNELDVSSLFVQSEPDVRLYGTRPVEANIHWPLENPEGVGCETPQDYGCKVVELHRFEWPPEGQYRLHVRTAAFTSEPDDDAYQYRGSHYPNSEPFNPDREGWSVLEYAHTGEASTYDAALHPSMIEVVKTVEWDDAYDVVMLDERDWDIGVPVEDLEYHTAPGSGYVLHLAADQSLFPPYDGVGDNRAYDRDSRTGPIVPVNRVIPGVHDDLIVVWYQPSAVPGVYWGGAARRYVPQWPAAQGVLDIASGDGSGPLDPLAYPRKRIYTQPDPDQPGYNLNDEHALFVSSGAADELFALRGDLGGLAYPGATGDDIRPFVLLKYWDNANGRWAFKVYEVVVPPSTGFSPADDVTAGSPVLPPYPMSTLSSCDETFPAGECSDTSAFCRDDDDCFPATCQRDEPFWQDYKGGIWARSGPSADSDGKMGVHYYYPLQPGFWYGGDLNDNGQLDDETVGTCVPWLDRLSGGTPGTPVEVRYQAAWPVADTVATLYVGETLLSARRGLPEITNQPSSEIIYDETDHDSIVADPAEPRAQAQLIDVLSPRAVPLSNARFNDAGLDTDIGEGGATVILGGSGVKVPPLLRKRLRYDPLATNCVTNTDGSENCIVGELVLEGLFDDTEVGEPLLALNVLAKQEYQRLGELDDGVEDVPNGDWPTKDCFPVAGADPAAYECTWDEALEALYHLARNPRRIDGDDDTDGLPDAELLIGLQDEDGDGISEPFRAMGVPAALTAGAATLPVARNPDDPDLQVGEGFLTLAFNNDPGLSPLPVSVSVIRVACPPYQGEVDVIEPDNIFDELLTLHHSGDFGGDPDGFWFEWWRRDDPDWTCLPDEGGCTEWQLHDQGQGLSDVTIEGSDLTTLSDNYYVVRYLGEDGFSPPYPVCEGSPASDWTGGPGSEAGAPVAKLAEGWVKRVVRSLNAFETRVTSFHTTPTNTYSSMLVQLGERYEGDVAFSNDPEYLNNIGLIEAYETVVRRALELNEDQDYEPANRQILLAASRIADFYTLLGNEAHADALDPTIALGTESELGTLAPAVFAFENQLDSLLEEELTLLRGRDDSLGTPTNAPPVYNRDFWNFTSGDGEVAYAQTYAVTDETADGVIDEADARVLYPQGHGDAWGHYLTAMKSYYRLLRDPDFTWLPRSEQVEVAGADVEVDYLDERKFARTAALKARTGAELVDLTYRDHYVEDSTGWWQGYKDSEEVQPGVPRAWGFDGWARRAAQAAYFDWAVANAVLPDRAPGWCSVTTDQACDEDLDCPGGETCEFPTGIRKIDRTTVVELAEIPGACESVQARADDADRGLNPLGLARGVVPFDIDPSEIAEGKTHFEQIHQRALGVLGDALAVYDHANQVSQSLRRHQDSAADFSRNVAQQERDYTNRLIEIFGLPYDDDIGTGRSYPSGYDGPDLYHFMYVDRTALTEQSTGSETVQIEIEIPEFTDETTAGEWMDDLLDELANTGAMTYEVSLDGTGFEKPESWTGRRRAPGELQILLSYIYQNRARFESAVREYRALIRDIEAHAELLEAQYALNADEINVLKCERDGSGTDCAELPDSQESLSEYLRYRTGQQHHWESEADSARYGAIAVEAVMDCMAQAMDFWWMCAVSGLVLTAGEITHNTYMDNAQGELEEQVSIQSSKEQLALSTAIHLETARNEFEVHQAVAELEQLVRREPAAVVELYTLEEAIQQSVGLYRSKLAEGQRLLEELIAFRKATAADTQTHRYRDMAFRVFRNDAIQKYRAQFDMAARYAYLAATAYDYETNLLGSAPAAGRNFLTDIVRQRSLGQVINGNPVAGSRGLADPLDRMEQNFGVLRGQLGFNNPQTETNAFSLRSEFLRQTTDPGWRDELAKYRVANLWDVPEFRRYARPFAPEQVEPGLVIGLDTAGGQPLSTTVTSGLNFFGELLGTDDAAYDPSLFATKVRAVGVWFEDYDRVDLASTPRVYLIPAGMDVLRSPESDYFETREWRIIDQKIPVPYPITDDDLTDPGWIPMQDSLAEDLAGIRRFSSFRAYEWNGDFTPGEATSDSRLVGRSVWNTKWLLIIPGRVLYSDPAVGLNRFIDGLDGPGGQIGVSDIKLYFQTYGYSGN